ncbi:hypothetical protein PN36_30560 [Candidatus Thiomargarita nelsonii]|uniref:Teneurin-like YD-shell domain-containing protein n=1 Tax=Candidatus Thiomargarita nelsonii TaxID=1003181 RepID=A0A4E0RDK7_9GAMM|nr:hypothetical protein PN36_30560 [Candidatus Thiomargarita nelsonii]
MWWGKIIGVRAGVASMPLSQSYEYFANGLKKSFTGADGVQIGYVYDENNRLVSVEIPDAGLVTVNGFEWNSPARVTLPGGSSLELDYDQLMRLESKVVKEPAEGVVLDYGYVYSPTSNIVAKSTEHGEYSYVYDELYRLSGAISPVLEDESFVYDLLGNRLSGGATFDGNNALLSNDEASFEYDLNGNLVRKSVGAEVTVFVYDVGDRLVRVEDGSGGVVAEYFYDPFGRWLFKDVGGVRTYFVYSDEGLVGEFDESGVELRGYGFRPNSTWTTNPLFLKVGGVYFWFLNDHLGTPQKIVDEQGVVVWEGVYEAFGKARVDVEVVESNLRFAGQYFDFESGLHYNFHRFYDPEVGRYFRVDPVWAVNLYGYVNGNPISSIDPEGKWIIPLISWGIGAALLLYDIFKPIKPDFSGSGRLEELWTIPGPFRNVKPFANQTCKLTAKTGARKLETVAEWDKADKEAIDFYNAIRASNSNDDIIKIAQNSGMPEFQIQRIKQHLFFDNLHDLNGRTGSFDPDIEIADAWRRLQSGTHNQQDLMLLQHEYFESRFEKIFQTNYDTAHNAAVNSGRNWKP